MANEHPEPSVPSHETPGDAALDALQAEIAAEVLLPRSDEKALEDTRLPERQKDEVADRLIREFTQRVKEKNFADQVNAALADTDPARRKSAEAAVSSPEVRGAVQAAVLRRFVEWGGDAPGKGVGLAYWMLELAKSSYPHLDDIKKNPTIAPKLREFYLREMQAHRRVMKEKEKQAEAEEGASEFREEDRRVDEGTAALWQEFKERFVPNVTPDEEAHEVRWTPPAGSGWKTAAQPSAPAAGGIRGFFSRLFGG